MQIACIAQMFLCLSVLAASPGSSQQTSESVTVQVKTMARKPNGTLACIPEPNVCPPLCGAVACWLCVAFKVIFCAASSKFARGCCSFPSQTHALSLFLRSCVPSEMMSSLLQVFGVPDVTCDASASIAIQTQVCAQRPSACLCLMVTCCAMLCSRSPNAICAHQMPSALNLSARTGWWRHVCCTLLCTVRFLARMSLM